MSAHPAARLVMAVAAVFAGCAGVTHLPVPVVADREAAEALAGVWQGTYESHDTGRVGDIYLALAAPDSASGEVVMVSRGAQVSVQRDGQDWSWEGVPRPQVLRIQSLRIVSSGPRIYIIGEIERYQDPDCGCQLWTTFRGELEGETVFGTFSSAAEHPVHDARGTWSAVRRPDG